MMSFCVEFSPQAREGLLRLFQYLLDHAQSLEDLDVAERALAAVETAAEVHLSRTPFIDRKAAQASGLRRKLIVPFGAAGYVLLYEIVGPSKVVELAVRHPLEQDCHRERQRVVRAIDAACAIEVKGKRRFHDRGTTPLQKSIVAEMLKVRGADSTMPPEPALPSQ